MKAYLIFLILVIVTSSCKDQEIENKKLIIGEWKSIFKDNCIYSFGTKIPIPPSEYLNSEVIGYQFYDNLDCENKQGYFKEYRNITNNKRDGYIEYLGHKTKYIITKDSLNIYNLEKNNWDKYKVLNLNKDSLTLIRIRDTIYFIKTSYQIDKYENYDQIILSSSGCYGSCPILSISIDKNGEVIYYGHNFNKTNGLFKAKVDFKLFKEIEYEFKKARVNLLNDKFTKPVTDMQYVNVHFIRNGQIVKSISDYGNSSPEEFYWAYNRLMYLYQKLDLVKIDKISNKFSYLIFDN